MVPSKDSRWKLASSDRQVKVERSPRGLHLHFIFRYDVTMGETDPKDVEKAWKKEEDHCIADAQECAGAIQKVEEKGNPDQWVTSRDFSFRGRNTKNTMEAVTGALIFHNFMDVLADEDLTEEGIEAGLRSLREFARII